MNTAPHTDHDKGTRAQAGFTLVEIMVVIVILGILATIVGTNVLGQSDQARVDSAGVQIKQLHENVKLYMARNAGPVPTWEQMLERDPKGHRYVDSDDPLVDPWGNDYEILPDPDYPNIPLVRSWGPDGQEGTDDDIDNTSIGKKRQQ